MTNTHETILHINLTTLEANFNFLKSKLPNAIKTVAVVKAFAYGLGDIEISKCLEKLGVHAFWVADFEEGVQLRKEGITRPIIVANPGYKSVATIIQYQLEPVIFNHRLLELYANCKEKVSIHIKFNTGMNRYGFEATDLQKILPILKNNPQLNTKSVCSHLSSSNDPNKEKKIKFFSSGKYKHPI